ncbi:MAG: methyltransferase domain-containing protein [Armatimonadota bacterium]|nr:methyltransferase domain-containing protein [Armatimonadota bacterium]
MSFSYKLKRTLQAVRQPGEAGKIVRQKINRTWLNVKSRLYWDKYCDTIREPKRKYAVPHTEVQDKVIDDLIKNGFDLRDFQIDVADYKDYIKRAAYSQYAGYAGGSSAKHFTEKSLEHYLATKALNLSNDDIFIDVANAGSPVPDIYNRLFGCKVYRQDLIFPEGVNGNTIGGDACKMPIEDGFATAMSLHCSFEHFEQDVDMRFIREANRVLAKGGKLCIVPFYLHAEYSIQTDPVVLPKGGISFESGAVVHCAKGWRNRHGRCYDVPHLISRIVNNLGDLKLTIYVVKNEKQVDPSCYVKFIGLFEKQ